MKKKAFSASVQLFMGLAHTETGRSDIVTVVYNPDRRFSFERVRDLVQICVICEEQPSLKFGD